MSNPVVYINPQGKPISHVSYSSRKDFAFCNQYFALTKIEGWSTRGEMAAGYFGKAVESAVQYHIENGGVGGTVKFVELWNKVKTLPEFPKLTYRPNEGSWEGLLRTGYEHLTIFEARLPYLPISLPDTRFQVPLSKEIFPGSRLAGITNRAYLDMVTKHRVHGTPLIIDIKTAGGVLNEKYVALDPQLIEYSWQTGIRDVGFLWFVKKEHGYKPGSKVTLLREINKIPAGTEMTVMYEEKTDEQCQDRHIWLGSDSHFGRYQEAVQAAVPSGRGNAATAARVKWLQSALGLLYCLPGDFSKQKMQFAYVTLPEQDVLDAGRQVGILTVAMISAFEQGFYPKQPGIRFPNNKCTTCYMRSICSGDTVERDATLTRVGEEWMDEMRDAEDSDVE